MGRRLRDRWKVPPGVVDALADVREDGHGDRQADLHRLLAGIAGGLDGRELLVGHSNDWRDRFQADRRVLFAGTLANSPFSPSDIVGCVNIASRNIV
jgi:hypothetical protein